mgnify:CR=1 FL=1|tara:strand:+ start:2023 stop:2625 length:603 start_codon:yes stop_codon:yes gene_type:complete
MGRKSLNKKRKPINKKVDIWLGELLLNIQNKDLEKLTIDDLAKLAEKSKSTIYEYFESKEEILLAACKTRITTLSETISNTLQQKIDVIKLYERLVEIFAEGTSGISISFLQGIKQSYPNVWSIIENFTDNFVEILKEQYKLGIKEGIFNPISVDLMSHLDKIFVMQVVTNPTLFNDKEYTISKLISDYLNLRLKGLLKN